MVNHGNLFLKNHVGLIRRINKLMDNSWTTSGNLCYNNKTLKTDKTQGEKVLEVLLVLFLKKEKDKL